MLFKRHDLVLEQWAEGRSRSFKVIQGDTNGKVVCDLLLVVNSYTQVTSQHYRDSVTQT